MVSDGFAHEKKEMISQIVLLKKDIEKLQLDLSKRNGELEGMAAEHDRAVGDNKALEVEKNHLQLQVCPSPF